MTTNNSLNANSTTPLPIVDGGTASNAVIIAPTASSWAGWDTNKNFSANNPIAGYTTIATAAGTTVLTVSSTYQQYFTGSTTQTVTMPVTGTLVLGQSFLIVNNSSGTVTVQSSGANTIIALGANTQSIITCILTTGTTAASWNAETTSAVAGVSSITGTTNQVIASASTGAVTLSLPQSIATTSAVEFASVKFSGNNGLLDSNGNELLEAVPTASAVNFFSLKNNTTGNGPIFASAGANTNIVATFNGKGTGGVQTQGSTSGNSQTAGYVGEQISSVVSTLTTGLSNNTNTNITSINLTAGGWIVFGSAGIGLANTTTLTAFECWVSTSSATLPDISLRGQGIGGANTGAQIGGISASCPVLFVNSSGSTTVFLSCMGTFQVSTAGAGGTITGLRIF